MAWAIDENGKLFEIIFRATGTVEWTNEGVAELVEREVKRAKGKSRPPRLFKQSDVARALRATKAAGVKASVEIAPDGKLSIIPAGDEDAPKINPWDEVLDKPQAKPRPRLS